MTSFNVKENLELFLPTFNRREHLAHTLEQLTAENSPVRACRLTILDNCSTDGTSELIDGYCARFSNIIHVCHAKNIGGNANIARCFEKASAEYVWVLCDDDSYDFSHAHELEKALAQRPGALFVVKTEKPCTQPAEVFKELSFVPAAIYRTDLITSDTLIHSYFNIAYMFPQLAVAAEVFNQRKAWKSLLHPLVIRRPEPAYTRGMKQCSTLLEQMDWLLGYMASITLLNDKKMQQACAFALHIDGDNFYNLCGRFMSQPSNCIYLYGEGIRLFAGKAKWLFILLAWPAFICSFYKTDHGRYARLLGKIKFKVWPAAKKAV